MIRSQITTVLYESPNRVADTLCDLVSAGAADRPVVLARELTKKFEEISRGTVADLALNLDKNLKGEIVLLLSGAQPAAVDEDTLYAHVAELRAAGASPREVVDRLISAFGIARNLAYKLAHDPPSA
jgi:16S rRNA (cytidine1402-2'-O)-methyltransferase